MFSVGRFMRYRGSTQQFSRGGSGHPALAGVPPELGPDGLKLERIRHFYTEIFLSCIQVF